MVAAALLVLALAGSALAAPTDGPPPAPPPAVVPAPSPPPLPDLTGAEAPVAAKLAAAHRFVTDHPTSAFGWGVLAMTLDVHGFAEAALPCYRRAAELAPTDFRWPYYRAIALAVQGAPKAVAALEQARTLAPSYAPLEVRLGDALLAAGETDRAADAYSRAVALDPKLPQAHLGLARAALSRGDSDQGDLDRALAETRAAVAAAADYGAAHGLLADLLRRRGEADAAARELAIAGRLPAERPLPDPVYGALAAEGVSSFWCQRRGRVFLQRREWRRAYEELSAAVTAAGDRPRAELFDDLGLALQGLGRPAEAAAQHRAALAVRPDFAAAQVHLGEALAAAGDLAGAIAAEEKGVALDPAMDAAALDLGTLLVQDGRWSDAAAAFRRGLAADPADSDDPRLQARLAWLLATAPEAGVRDGAEAVRLAERASKSTGDRLPAALDVLAAAYAEAGRFADAAASARRAGDLAREAGDSQLADEIAGRLALYAQGKPYRLPPGS